MRVHLVDGTFELFRHFYGGPPRSDGSREARGAVAGVIQTLIGMLEGGATHIGVATDHVIESFRNDLYPGYKTGEGIDPQLREQFVPLEEAVATLGVAIWPMVEVEADDALAAVAASAASDARVEQVIIYTPDKDLAQCVRGERVVQFDRRSRSVLNADAVVAKFGVPPLSIPDYLALTGDSSDGFPGLPGWGSKSASAVLSRYGRLEDIPASATDWDLKPRGAAKLAEILRERWNDAMLFRTLATLRTDQPAVTVEDLEYRRPTPEFEALAASWGRPALFGRAKALAEGRS
ncbi:MAG TPA: 5'-3' exonuclease H3TH domain-containing protein [Candidatus Limnocylindrales bacterium]|nr:5'-3' exonuclease H3TH domain-containing protein [Candidatus Limnocylindrales bacterium]